MALKSLEAFPTHQEIISKWFSFALVLLCHQLTQVQVCRCQWGEKNISKYGRKQVIGTNFLLLYTFCSYFYQCSRLLFKVSVYHSSAACMGHEALANQNGMLKITARSRKVTKSLSRFTTGTSICRGAGQRGICLNSFWGKNLLIKWKGAADMEGIV